MTKLKDYLGLVALLVGIALPLLSRVDQQRNLDGKVSDLAKAVLSLQATQDSIAHRAEIDAAVAAVRDSLRQRGHRREPTQPEIVGELAKSAAETPPVDSATAKPIEQRQMRLKRYATMK